MAESRSAVARARREVEGDPIIRLAGQRLRADLPQLRHEVVAGELLAGRPGQAALEPRRRERLDVRARF